MTEIYTIALSSLGILMAQYCKGVADSVAYDGKRGDTHYHIGTPFDMWHVMSRLSVIICYVTALSAGAYVMAQEPSFRQTLEHYGLYEWLVWAKTPENAMLEWIGFERITYDSQAWWFWPMGICHAIAGIVGFNLGDRFKGSMWMRYLGNLINRSVE